MTSPAISTPTNARSRRTRGALLSAAREVLEREGAPALTMSAVADRAGVTRRTAYLHFGSRTALISALFDHLAETEGLHRSLERVWSAPEARSALDAWAVHLSEYHPRLLAVDRAIERDAQRDEDAATHRRRVAGEKLRNARRLADWLDRDEVLAPEWNPATAADMLYSLISSDVIEALIVDRRWSRKRLAAHLAVLLRRTFTLPETLQTAKGTR
ncbi:MULTISPECIES: TetR/AcrR family transcriptional regulator [unclassified Nocardioides]|uniref:TetR/AcrR family transcriptional regulator n=1 Tax=unclassified Nocardioides TaxID=2615069 RepID=UPI0009EFD074|nr:MULTISPECIES: TetR/AcrR family transcriptional regulator [unclassified Nocardioides]GAW48003.1 Transcriptional regulator, TetR family [Nocardioides sp. PD653-B2]GAW53694.1 Transcriptional regulator, TetR family [Nocardioides sp. PD653]